MLLNEQEIGGPFHVNNGKDSRQVGILLVRPRSPLDYFQGKCLHGFCDYPTLHAEIADFHYKLDGLKVA